MCSVKGSSKAAGRMRYLLSVGMGINVDWAEGCVLAKGNWVEGNLYVAVGKGQERCACAGAHTFMTACTTRSEQVI